MTRSASRPFATFARAAMMLLASVLVLASATARAELASTATPPSGSAVTSSPPSLAGRWAQLFVTTSESRAPVIGTVRSTTRTVLIADIVQRDTRLEIETRVCDIDIRSNAPVDTIIPRRFIDALRPVRTTAWLSEASRGWTITRWSHVDPIGVRLDDAWSDPLPSRADDPRVFDQDGDGHPGVTVQVRGLIDGEIYVIQRGWSEMRDVRVDADTIRGTVRWGMDQSVVGASRWLLDSQPPTWPVRDDALNYVVLERVASGDSCRIARDRFRGR